MQFFSQTTSDGVIERSFTVGDVPGVLWSPAGGTDPAPLVLMGHPGGLHKRAVGMVARAAHLVTAYGFHAVAIDAPGHGERARSVADTAWLDEMQRARKAGEPLGAIVAGSTPPSPNVQSPSGRRPWMPSKRCPMSMPIGSSATAG